MNDLIAKAAAAYSKMKEAAADYDEALENMVNHPDFRVGLDNGTHRIVDNFAKGNRVFRSLPMRQHEVEAIKK